MQDVKPGVMEHDVSIQALWGLTTIAKRPGGKVVGTLKLSHTDSITFKENENDIFDMSHTLYKNVCVCSFPIFDIFDIHSITALRCM